MHLPERGIPCSLLAVCAFAAPVSCHAPRQVTPVRGHTAPHDVVSDATFALAVSRAAAVQSWRDWHPGAVAFEILYAKEQWLFGAGHAPAGYEVGPYASALGPVFTAPSWTRCDGSRGQWTAGPQGFFAQTNSFDGVVCFTIPAPGLAPFPAADWATIFTHEYFHAFQFQDPRWTGDRPLITQERRQELAALYEANADVRDSVAQELAAYLTLLDGLQANRSVDCGQVLPILRIRADRAVLLENLRPGLSATERALERLEGTARYVEEGAYASPDAVALFRQRQPDWTLPEHNTLRVRRVGVMHGEYYYATGYAAARLLDACRPGWKALLAGLDLATLAAP